LRKDSKILKQREQKLQDKVSSLEKQSINLSKQIVQLEKELQLVKEQFSSVPINEQIKSIIRQGNIFKQLF
jgi:hypothetical protein